MRCAPLGVGLFADVHLLASSFEFGFATTAARPPDSFAVLERVLPPAVEPHAANVRARVAVVEQHSSRRAALELTDIEAA
jgi:hypothetical protein